MRRRGVAGKVDTDDAQPDLAAPRAGRAEILPNERSYNPWAPPGRSTLWDHFLGRRRIGGTTRQRGPARPPSGTWAVRIRLDRVAHRPVFLRISRWRLDRVFVGLRVGDRRLFRFGGLRTRGRDGLFGHAKESRAQRLGSAIPPR